MEKIIEAGTTDQFKYYGICLTTFGLILVLYLFRHSHLASALLLVSSVFIFYYSHFSFMMLGFETLEVRVGPFRIKKVSLEDIIDLDNIIIRECRFNDNEVQVFSFKLVLSDSKEVKFNTCFLASEPTMRIIELISEVTLGRNWQPRLAKLQ